MRTSHGPVVKRERDAMRTRGEILRAAQSLFAKHGYAGTGVREIAGLAGVNPALIVRYFGSKEGLFRAALEQIDMSALLRGERRRFGADLMAAVLASGDESFLAMLVLSASDPVAHAASVEFLRTTLVGALAEWLGPPNARERAARIGVLWIGFLTSWKLLPLLDDSHLDATCRWVQQSTQEIVDEGPVAQARAARG